MFNALKYTEILEKVGFSREQAETSVKVLIEVMDDNFATKHDLKEFQFGMHTDLQKFQTEVQSDFNKFKSEIRTDIQEFKTEIRTDIQQFKNEVTSEIQSVRHEMKLLEQRMTIKLGTLMVICMSVLTTLNKIL